MPKVDIQVIERIVRENIRNESKASELITALHDILKDSEGKKGAQSHRSKSKKKFALIVSSQEEFASDGKLVIRVANKLEDLIPQKLESTPPPQSLKYC